jgi:hypothetical protein
VVVGGPYIRYTGEFASNYDDRRVRIREEGFQIDSQSRIYKRLYYDNANVLIL